MEGMKADRMRGSDQDERDLTAGALYGADDEAASWKQQQLLPEAGAVPRHADRPNDRLRRAGLVGIAQAREALAEAARRAKAREESRAA
jgi:hypothetical protein